MSLRSALCWVSRSFYPTYIELLQPSAMYLICRLGRAERNPTNGGAERLHSLTRREMASPLPPIEVWTSPDSLWLNQEQLHQKVRLFILLFYRLLLPLHRLWSIQHDALEFSAFFWRKNGALLHHPSQGPFFVDRMFFGYGCLFRLKSNTIFSGSRYPRMPVSMSTAEPMIPFAWPSTL